MTVRKLTIEVTPWPDDEHFDPDNPHYQWDAYQDGVNIGGGTGPGDALAHAFDAVEALAEWSRDSWGL